MPLTLGTLALTRPNFVWTEGDEQPTFDIKIKAGGCGSVAGGFPVVESFRPVYWVRPLTVCCMGTTEDAAFANADLMLAEIVAANTKTRIVYLERKVANQTTPHFWTVLGGVPKHIRQYWDRVFKVWYQVDLYVYPGQQGV